MKYFISLIMALLLILSPLSISARTDPASASVSEQSEIFLAPAKATVAPWNGRDNNQPFWLARGETKYLDKRTSLTYQGTLAIDSLNPGDSKICEAFTVRRDVRTEKQEPPRQCTSWFDGCNTCEVVNGKVGACTKKLCTTPYEQPRCVTYADKQPKECTTEAKLCPDGSGVGRNPNKNCEFDSCPGEKDESLPEYKKVLPTAPVAADSVESVPTLVSPAMWTEKPDVAVVQTEAAVAAAVAKVEINVKQMEPIIDLVEPSAIDIAVVGDKTYQKEVVKVADIKAVQIDVETQEQRRNRLFDDLAKLAKIVGREEYLLFTMNEDKVGDALEEVLRRKNVRIMTKDQHEWQWKPLVQRFIDYNKIDVAAFNTHLRKAQKDLVLAQINTYNALLLLQANHLDAAEDELKDARRYYQQFQASEDWLNAEIARWKPLPADIEVTEYCVTIGDAQGPVVVHEKINEGDKQLVLVSYNEGASGFGSGGKIVQREIVGDITEDISDVDVAVEETAVVAKQIQKKRGTEKSPYCQLNGEKVPAGTRLRAPLGDRDDVAVYCDSLTKQLLEQKEEGAAAENNYECESNESRYGKCVNSYGFLQRIWKAIASVLGF